MPLPSFIERYVCMRKAKYLEASLAIFVLSLRTKLLAGLTLETAILKLRDELSGELKEELSKIIGEVDKGKDISDAFAHAATQTCSIEFKKVLSHLNQIAQNGYSRKNDTLKLLSKELSSMQLAKIRNYSSKLAIISLIFIASTVVLPALWLAFVVMGSAFFALDIEPLHVLVVTTVAFPMIGSVVLLYMKEVAPI
ncbi:MAG: type II secretion system F family protein [Candidatus Diapherotrites archaeon]|nr:type II secretion system F family protein [Candidatus Diapherotrites archaeon]